MKALLAAMHPRRLPFFVNSIRKIDYMDVALAKNYPLVDAQNVIIKFFLSHDYDILIFTSDDTEIPSKAPLQILTDMEALGHDIITGWSNCREKGFDANITLNTIPQIDAQKDHAVWYHQYHFLSLNELQKLLKLGKYMVPVWFVGWSLTAMTRKVVEKWKPRGWYFQHTEPFHYVHEGKKGCWCSSDLWFSWLMWKNGFSKYADLRVFVPHHPPFQGKTNQQRASMLMVGKEPSKLEVITTKK